MQTNLKECAQFDCGEPHVVYGRYSHDHQSPTSISDQGERCLDFAWRHHQRRPGGCASDYAQSVKDTTAPNWNRLLDEIRAGRVKTVYVDELSRIVRNLEELLYVQRVFRFHGAHLYSVLEGVDITDENADIDVIFAGYKNQAATRDARHRVKRGMDGNIRRNLSNGDLRLGYTSVPLTDDEVHALGLVPRHKDVAPYRKLVIDEPEADIVRKMHYWFAVDRMSIRAITRRLNEMKVPRGGKARTTQWKPIHVRKILESRRYLGYRWRNKTKIARNPDTGGFEIQAQAAEDYLEVHCPELAIIDQATFDRTMRRFEEIHKVHPAGAKGWQRANGSARDYAPKHVLSGVLVCGQCNAKLSQMSGHQGGYYGCPNAAISLCDNKVKANRGLAEQLLLEAIQAELDENVVVDLVATLLDEELSRSEAALDSELKSLRSALQTVEQELQHIVRVVTSGCHTETLTNEIREREERKAVLERRLREAERLAAIPPPTPDRTWVHQQLTDSFAELLKGNPARAAAVMQQITGPIRVYPETKPWLRQAHLVARFSMDCSAACRAVSGTADMLPDPACAPGFGVELEVQLRKVPFYERYGPTVVRMHDDLNMSLVEIARALPGGMNPATIKLAYNFGKHGTPDPNGRGWANHCNWLEARRAARSDDAGRTADATPDRPDDPQADAA